MWELVPEGLHIGVEIEPATMKGGGGDDVEAQYFAVDASKRLFIARLGGVAHEIVGAGRWQRRFGAVDSAHRGDAEHGKQCFGAAQLGIDLFAALDLRRRELVIFQQAVGECLISRMWVVVKLQRLTFALQVVEVAARPRFFELLLN